MDDSLIDADGLSPERRSLLPGAGFFYPDSLDEDRADERAATALDGATTAVVADPDADGLACTALLREAFGRPPDGTAIDHFRSRVEADESESEDDGDDEWTPGFVDDRDPADPVAAVVDAVAGEESDADGDDEPGPRSRSEVALVPVGPTSVAEGLARVVAHADPGVDVYVCDLCPDAVDSVDVELAALVERAGSVRWFDHHQWDDEVAAAVRAAGVDLVVGESDEECSADVTLRSLEYDFPAHLRELTAVTRDHDLWLKTDDRSDDLADLSYWLGAEPYVELVREYGADLPSEAVAYLEQRRAEKHDRIDRAVTRADTHTLSMHRLPADERTDAGDGADPDEVTVAVTYGRCSQNEVAERLREQGADAAVVVKPSGAASLRGSERFRRCHEVARQVNGGGHPQAAGCKPDVYADMLDYAHHWSTRGAVARQAILDAFRTLE